MEGLTIVAVSFGEGDGKKFHAVNNEDELKKALVEGTDDCVLYFNAFNKNEQVAQRSLFEIETPA